ncbi:MAG: GNAT family N-acetyltransferase [Methylophilales bacterium]|nr:GNAT family N-acetyltransferase [Methylophilales bacterium]
MTLNIRPTTEKDAPALAKCVDAIAHERHFLASTEGFSVTQTRDYIVMLIVCGIHMLLCENTEVVGWCDITPGIFEGLDHVGHLSMGLLPAYRGLGWGKKLLQAALNSGFKEKFERIELEVFASNTAALALYCKAGFVEEGRKRKSRKLDGEYDDIINFGLLREEWGTLQKA